MRTCSKSGGVRWWWTSGHGFWFGCHLGWVIPLQGWQPDRVLFCIIRRVCWFFCSLQERAIWALPALRWFCWCCGACGTQSVPLASALSRPGAEALIVNLGVDQGFIGKLTRSWARFQKRSVHCDNVIGSVMSPQFTISLSDRIPQTILLRSDHDPGRSCSLCGSVLNQKFHHNNRSFYL